MKLPAFYPILDTGETLARGLHPVRVAEDILDGGARIIQFRHKEFLSRQALLWLEEIAQAAEGSGAMLVVNDRADLARLFGAALHLGQDDLQPAAARKVVGSGAAIGFSTHNEAQLLAAAGEPVDYVALGPIFATGTKANPDAVVGVEEMRRLRSLTSRPMVAIGGITRGNAREVLDAGADAVAVIADLLAEDDNILGRTAEWIRLLGDR